MGIDKADVRWIVHWTISATLEDFYQESGRAGRDGLESKSVVFVSSEDADLRRWAINKGKGGNAEGDSPSTSVLAGIDRAMDQLNRVRI